MKEQRHISKLHLFAKDTDAPDTVRGFKFQELKTLEIWLYNKVHNIDEQVYCDYEDDIFQRNLNEFKATFKQLKLYSSKNFSFSSIEVRKAISNFFMLFVKGEYLFDEPQFVFETNTSIASKKGNNDAELLKKWALNQDKLEGKFLQKCVTKLKEIIDEYITGQYEKKEKSASSEELKIAKEVYENLPNDTWEKFAKSIKWKFSGISSDQAIQTSVNNSLALIKSLPFPINHEEVSLVFDTLRGIVSDKSMAKKPENRCLNSNLLDHTLLNLGNQEDKDYLQSFELWSKVSEINTFTFGEFYQVLFAAKYCRRSKYLEGHSEVWLNLLNAYKNNSGIPVECKREVIYEILWLTLRPSTEKRPTTSLKGLEELVFEYFSNFEDFKSGTNLEDASNLLSVVHSSMKMNLIDIEEGLITDWFVRFDSLIQKLKGETKDPNFYCKLLEIEGFTYLHQHLLDGKNEPLNKGLNAFEEIIGRLPSASFYPISQLGTKIETILDLLISFNPQGGFQRLEELSDKLLPLVNAREGNFSMAKKYVEKGYRQLNTIDSKGLLHALEYFHKAKDLYFEEATYEGFALSLLNLSQLYAGLGMNLAAKYYTLSSIWFCFEAGNSELYKKISEAYSLQFHAEFKQGSWINALQSFENYISTKSEFGAAPFDPTTDELLLKSLMQGAFIIALSPKISTQLSGLINHEKNEMGELYENFLKDFEEAILKTQSEIGLDKLLSSKLDTPPINDIGAKRIIKWKAFGSIWSVKFPNDYLHNSVGEEFCALLQIIQADIALQNLDFHFAKGEIGFELELVDEPTSPGEIPANSIYLWKIGLPILGSKDQTKKEAHYSAITASANIVLRELSLLSDEKFNKLFFSLFENGLNSKALVVNAYQRMYRDLVSKELFDAPQRDKFNSEVFGMDCKELPPMTWVDSESEYYKKEESKKNITARYNNCLESIHLTIDRIKGLPEFKSKVEKLRKDSWLDWQILMALHNNINDLKAKNLLSQNGKHYSNDNEWLKDFQEIFGKLINTDEKDTYVEISLSEIIGENLDFQIQQISIHVLGSFGLYNNSRYPNQLAVREFLNERFNFDEDENISLSPFS